MTIALICGDGSSVRVSKEYFEKSVFNNADIARARSYTLKCKARPQVVSALLDWMEGLSEKLTITEDNFEELQNLCKELGFSGLDKEFRAFSTKTGNDSVDLKEFLQVKERVTRQDKLLSEIQRQLAQLSNWKRNAENEMRESVSRQFQSLEKKFKDLERASETRNAETSQKTERALKEFAKQSDLEELARNVRHLKENLNAVQVRTAKSLEVIETKPSGLPRLKQDSPTKAAQPTLRHRREFVYNSSKPREGVIAYLTRECGGNVHDEGIVNVTVSSVYDGTVAKDVVDLQTSDWWVSEFGTDIWICYDFKDRRVIPKSYSFEFQYAGPGGTDHKIWVIEGSTDGYSWTEADRRDDPHKLEWSKPHNLTISRVPSEGFRFIRFRHVGLTRCRNYALILTFLEIFGTLLEK